MPMALLGAAFLAWELWLTRWLAAQFTKQGRPAREAWRRLPLSGLTWMGVVLIVSAVNPTAGAGLLLLVCLVGAAFFLVLAIRGVRDLPQFLRHVRRIGDPDAWRGKL